MKTLLSAIALSALSVSAVHAEMAIDGKDYETTIPVTMENFDRAEAAVNFNKWVSKGIMNSSVDLTDLYPAGPAPTVRANRDTLYTVGFYDNLKGIHIEQPDNGIFQSALVLDENGFAKDYVWTPGGFDVKPTDGFVLVIFRIGLEKGIAAAREAQKTLSVSDLGTRTYVTPRYNKADRDALWSKLNKQAIGSGIFLEYAFDENTIDPRTRSLSNAAGWGGMAFSVNNYQMSTNIKGTQCMQTTFEDPRVDEFWSFTLYDAEGWLLPIGDNVLNGRDAVANEDGTYTLSINCGDDAINNITTGDVAEWSVTWRSYGSSYKVKSGQWNPILDLRKAK
ncbi:MAG: DUF1214 domain-containing protein [bacterium]|nr:DUF1214 domain-containing protein [bacterium]